ncbi:FHA domain-containing protein [Streptomyces sp. NPDC127098]|uniref:FHA domain-containing protein n=1 Tax=Streptomyces sp. NPDC127098 TaxID=3347137 RepID=UPI00366432F2
MTSDASTLHASSMDGAVTSEPRPGLTVRFGRGIGPQDEGPDVDLRVGAADLQVSRRQGELSFRHGHWWLRNVGTAQLRLSQGRWLFRASDPVLVTPGYTTFQVLGSGSRVHLVELFVTELGDRPPAVPPGARTVGRRRWPLRPDERLILAALGQRYLAGERDPQPLTYRQVAELLDLLHPRARWREPRVRRTVDEVRGRLAQTGFPYPLREGERGEASDNRLKHNLLTGLFESDSLRPEDLGLLDDGVDG